MDFVEWLKERYGLTWPRYECLNDYDQRELVRQWTKSERKEEVSNDSQRVYHDRAGRV